MLSVDADIPDSVDLFGKKASDLQQDITVTKDGDDFFVLDGELKHVNGYTGFSSDPEEQSGLYLALHFASSASDVAYLTAELNGGKSGEVRLDDDGLIVFRLDYSISTQGGLTEIFVRGYNENDEQVGEDCTVSLMNLIQP